MLAVRLVPWRLLIVSKGAEAKPTVTVVPLMVATLKLVAIQPTTPLFQEPLSCTALDGVGGGGKTASGDGAPAIGDAGRIQMNDQEIVQLLPMVPVLALNAASTCVPTLWLPVMFAPFMEPVKLPAFMLPVMVAFPLTVRLPPTVTFVTTTRLSLMVMLFFAHVGAPSVNGALVLKFCEALQVCDWPVRAMVASGWR